MGFLNTLAPTDVSRRIPSKFRASPFVAALEELKCIFWRPNDFSAAGQSYRTIMKQEGCSQDFVAPWKERFRAERLAGLYAWHRGKIVSEDVNRKAIPINIILPKRL
jgi:hypothetical protein